jgi:hypothetical protein
VRHSALSLLSVVLLFSGGVYAAPDDPEQEDSLEVVLENRKDADGNPKGCYFRIRGKTQPFIDGTKLQVTLQAHGRSREFLVKIKRAVVKNRTYEVSHPWPARVFAPLLYEVKVELNVRKQAKNVQQWIMTEYGYALTHQEILDRKRFAFGGEEKRAAFALANIEKIMSFVGSLETLRQEVADSAAKPAAEVAEWPDLQKSLNTGIIRFRDELDRYFRRYVVLLEQGFYARFKRINSLLARIISDHGRGKEGTAIRLDRLSQELVATQALIREHAPATHEDALIPDDEGPLIPDEEDEGKDEKDSDPNSTDEKE